MSHPPLRPTMGGCSTCQFNRLGVCERMYFPNAYANVHGHKDTTPDWCPLVTPQREWTAHANGERVVVQRHHEYVSNGHRTETDALAALGAQIKADAERIAQQRTEVERMMKEAQR